MGGRLGWREKLKASGAISAGGIWKFVSDLAEPWMGRREGKIENFFCHFWVVQNSKAFAGARCWRDEQREKARAGIAGVAAEFEGAGCHFSRRYAPFLFSGICA